MRRDWRWLLKAKQTTTTRLSRWTREWRQLTAVYVGLVTALWLVLEAGGFFGTWGTSFNTLGVTGLLLMFTLPVLPTLLWAVYLHYNPDLTPVRICQFQKLIPYLPIYVADSAGFFRDNGISISIFDGLGDDATWKHVKNGDAEFGVADPVVLVQDRDTPGCVVAAIVGKISVDGVSRKQIPRFSDPGGFAGKTVAVYEAPSTVYMLAQRMSERLPAGAKPMVIREMKPGTEWSQIINDDVDITLVAEPFVTAAEDSGAYRVFAGASLLKHCLVTGLYCTRKYAEENSTTVQRVVNAIEQSLRFIHSHPLEALKIAAKHFPDSKNYAVERAVLRLLAEGVIPKHCTILDEPWLECLKLRVGDSAMNYPKNQHVKPDFAKDAAKKFSETQ